MAKKIGNLSAIVTANTAQFHKGLKGAAKSVEGFKSNIMGVAGGIGVALAGIGAAIGVGMGVEQLKGVAEAIDKTAKTADRLGITTEALVGLRHAAKLAGMEGESFDATLTTMTKNVGLAAMGTGKAKEAIKALGLDAQALSKVSPENQMKALADAMQSVTNPTEKVALAMKIFGDQGAEMISVLADGSAGLEAMQADAAKLGLTFNRVDAAKVEMANDALTRLQGVFTGIAQTLVIQLAPYIQAAADAFTDWATSGEGMGAKVTAAVQWVAEAITYVSDIIDLGKLAWMGLKWVAIKALQGMIFLVGKFGESISWVLDKISFALPDGFAAASGQMAKDVIAFSEGLGDVAKETAQSMEDILVNKSTGEKVKEMFSKIQKDAQTNAEAIAKKSGAAPQAYTAQLKASLNATSDITEQLKDQVALKEKMENINFSGNGLIKAGSAQAQGLSSKSFSDSLVKAFQKQVELANKQVELQSKIATNTEGLADSETVDF